MLVAGLFAGAWWLLWMGSIAAALNNLDLKYRRPPLPGDEEPVMLGIVSNSIEDGFGIDPLIQRQ